MTIRVHDLQESRAAKVGELQPLLLKGATAELDDSERQRLNDLDDEVRKIGERIVFAERAAEMERQLPPRSVLPATEGERRKSWGEVAIESAELRSFINNGGRGSARIELRAVQNLGTVIAPDRRPDIIALPQRRLVIRDLLPQARTDSSTVEYVRQSAYTNAAATVLEATGVAGVGVKPESDMTLAVLSAPARVIAHVLTVSRQAMDDLPALRSFIDTSLVEGLRRTEEVQILSGNGTAPNLAGLIGAATAYETTRNVTGDKRVDVVHHAIAQLADAGLAATGIVMNLADFSYLVEQKDANGQYLSQGPFGTVDQPRLWGVPVAATPALAAGSFLVGDFRSAATLYDRLAPEVLVSSEHSDYFARNLLLVRAEERIALAIRMPAALITGTFGTITA